MENFGQQFKFRFNTQIESKVHPHVPEEKADLFYSMDMGSTEVEIINFINAISYCFKPRIALETGTYLGCGTIAIAQAMESNGFGKVITMDTNDKFLTIAKNNVNKVGLSHRVDFLKSSSFEVIENYKGDSFDLVFFDSEADRKKEFNMILERNLFSKNAVCIFHDTSALRHLTYPSDVAYVEFLNNLLNKYEGFCCPYSRGFHFLKIN